MSMEHGDNGVGEAARAAPAPAPPVPPVVLIVEDERSIAAVVAEVVEQMGYTPLLAAHGRQALDLAREHRPRLVITDLMMPRMGGAALITALRADAVSLDHHAPPILLLTAASLQYAREAGADAILRKPFNLPELEAAVLRLIGEAADP